MSNMPPRPPPRPKLSGSPPRRTPAPIARPHPRYMYEERHERQDRTHTHSRISRTPTSTSLSSTSSFSSYFGSSSGFASKARSALSSAGHYVANTASSVAAATSSAPDGKKQTWEEWARDWRDGRKAAIKGTETLYVVPGWAVKRPRKDGGDSAFDLHVSVSGFCNFVRDPGSVSRTQRAIIGIAKRLAALPAPPIVQAAVMGSEAFADSPTEAMEQEFDKLRTSEKDTAGTGATDQTRARDTFEMPKRTTTAEVFRDPRQLSAAHEFMDSRLQPFWSSVLAYRRVAITMYPVPLQRDSEPPRPDEELFSQEPLMRTTFTTDAQGHFAHNVVVPWEHICTHPNSLPMAFADDPANDRTDWGIVVRAQLLSKEGPSSLRQTTGTADAFGPPDLVQTQGHRNRRPERRDVSGTDSPLDKELPVVPRRTQGATTFFSAAEEPNRNDGDGETEMGLMGIGRSLTESWTVVDISRPGGIRIISDLDDTVKHTDILSGPREVFRNVFCRSVSDACVPGMDDLYASLQKLGLSGLHFVSNSPFELFPVVSEFLRSHNFPSYYSLRLKFYGGRSIVSSLFEPAGQRKRPSLVEIMKEFYDSQFILIGDSGEQDLEVYTSIAQERPEQVAAIFIRDVTSGRVDELRRHVQDYSDAAPSSSGSSIRSAASGPQGSKPVTPSIRSAHDRSAPPSPPSRTSTADDFAQTVQELQQLSAEEAKVLRRAAEWEARTARAYAEIPSSVRLVFFQHVDEIESLAKEIVKGAVKNNVHPIHPGCGTSKQR